MSGFKKLAAFVAANKERLGILGAGLLGNYALSAFFDYMLYPYAIWKLGILRGGIYMLIGSIIVCILMILFYDWSKKDWLGIETVKGLKSYEGDSKFLQRISRVLKKGDIAIMIFLSIKFDPFITTVYMRKGINEFNGMKKRDWKIFISSAIIANTYWTLVMFSGVSILDYLWKILRL